MADTAVDSTPEGDSSVKQRPEKPDEAKYRADLEQAEKDHKAAQAKFVFLPFSSLAILLTDRYRTLYARRSILYAAAKTRLEMIGSRHLWRSRKVSEHNSPNIKQHVVLNKLSLTKTRK